MAEIRPHFMTVHDYDNRDHLYNMVQKWRWQEILDRFNEAIHAGPNSIMLAKLRDEASAHDDRGYLPLHWASCNSTAIVRAVQCLVELYPQGLFHVSLKSGWTPLHMACIRGARPGIIEMLTEMDIEAAWTLDPKGCLPLHSICKYADTVPIDSIQRLLQAMFIDVFRDSDALQRRDVFDLNISILRRDKSGDTPLTTLAHAYRVEILEVRRLKVEGSSLFPLREAGVNNKFRKFLKKMKCILTVAACLTIGKKNGRTPLTTFHCSWDDLLSTVFRMDEVTFPEFIEYALWSRRSSQLRTNSRRHVMSDDGNYPLHLIASKELTNEKDIKYSRFRLKIRRSMEAASLRSVLRDCPEIAHERNQENMSALDLAINAGKNLDDGIDDLIAASPSALLTRISCIQNFPYILSSLANRPNCDASFMLLRSKPDLVNGDITATIDKMNFFQKFLCLTTGRSMSH